MYLWLKTLWHSRYRRKENCLYLVGDDDELDFVEALQDHFAVRIWDDPDIAEAENAGLLFDIVFNHTKAKHSLVDKDALWQDFSRFLQELTGHEQQINRQTTFFYYT